MCRHESSVGTFVEWYTPPEIFTALNLRFDLDPASPVGGLPWIPADRQVSVLEDGLSVPWFGAGVAEPSVRAGHEGLAGAARRTR